MKLKILDKKLKDLREELIEEALRGWNIEPGRIYNLSTDTHIAAVLVKRRTKVDEGALAQLLTDKGLYDECTKEVIDHDLVQQLYIEGKLTDTDLRSIDTSSPIFELTVTEREKCTKDQCESLSTDEK